RERRGRFLRGLREAQRAGHHRRQAVFIERRCIAELSQPGPAMMKLRAVQVRTVRRERMEERLTLRAPVDELDAELERRLGAAHEVELVDAEHGVEAANRRQRRLADTDGADL